MDNFIANQIRTPLQTTDMMIRWVYQNQFLFFLRFERYVIERFVNGDQTLNCQIQECLTEDFAIDVNKSDAPMSLSMASKLLSRQTKVVFFVCF